MNPVKFLRARRGLNLALIIAWAALIFAGSSVPGSDLPGGIDPYTTLMHAAEYSVLGFLALPCVRGRNPLLLAVAACALWGFSDEFHQLFVPGRTCSVRDAIVDVAGSAAGAAAAKLWGKT